MASAIIGALRVVLGMDAGEFTKGTQAAGAQAKGLERTFAAMSGNIAGSMQAAGAAILAAFGPAALAYAVKSAIDLADETRKMAQSVGLSVESLSRLDAAAGQAGLHFEDLRGGISKLANALQAAQERGSGAWLAFDALAVKTKDASGQLRAADDVINDVADRFAKMADGTNKTKIALELLGKSGAQWVPLLNTGSKGLKDLGDKAEAAGQVISTRVAKDAEEFNDTLTRLGRSAMAFGLGVAQEVLPRLTEMAKSLEDTNKSAKGWGSALGKQFDFFLLTIEKIPEATARVGGAFIDVAGAMRLAAAEQEKTSTTTNRLSFVTGQAAKALDEAFGKQANDARLKSTEEYRRAQEVFGQKLLESSTLASPLIKSLGDLRNVQDLLMRDQVTYADMANPTMMKIKAALDGGKITWEEYRKIAGDALNIQKQFNVDEMQAVLDVQSKSIEEKIAAVTKAAGQQAITWRQATNTIRDLEKQKQNAILDTANLAASTITAVFAKSKAAAIAAAVINTAVGVTRAFRDVPFPLNWAQAALVAATGAAQIAAISSSSESGGSSPTPGSGQASASAPQEAPAAPQRHVLEVKGLTPGQMISSEVVRAMAQGLIDFQRDGGEVVLA